MCSTELALFTQAHQLQRPETNDARKMEDEQEQQGITAVSQAVQ
jgi:hypothetical protein